MKFTYKKIIYVFLFMLFLFGCKPNNNNDLKESKLISIFKSGNTSFPKISAHRGGKSLIGYPENSLETIKHLHKSFNAIFEIDIAKTKDEKLILMHDKTIDRTTTGIGRVDKMTYDEINSYNLKDTYGNITTFSVPLFRDVLQYALKNDIVLSIDIKRSVDVTEVIKEIRDANAEDIAMIITYSVTQAEKVYSIAPDLLISTSIRNTDELLRIKNSKVPLKNIVAFTGTRLSDSEFYKALRKEKIVSMLGTLGNLDKKAKAKGDYLYTDWLKLGVDIIATDRPIAVYNTILK